MKKSPTPFVAAAVIAAAILLALLGYWLLHGQDATPNPGPEVNTPTQSGGASYGDIGGALSEALSGGSASGRSDDSSR